MRYDNETGHEQNSYTPNPLRCIALSLAVIYYFRLPTAEDNAQRDDKSTPSREELSSVISESIHNFDEIIQNELETFVNADNFVIPHGVAINQAIREHIFSIVVSIVSRIPLCIIGVPGKVYH
ncbi:unnamed protein product [Rotaria sp. Silwood2]|nr:unnamed protein product [Rotaria sp. Silwood2]